MNKQIPSYLKLVTDNPWETAAESEDLSAMVEVCRTFENATGWRLQLASGPVPSENSHLMWSAPVNPGVGASPGHIRLISTADHEPQISIEQVGPLAGALTKLWSELLTTRAALLQREAELAAGVPLVVREEESPALGEVLEAVLHGGAEAIGCQAAALYLLDPATTELKMRASWGLPRKRLTEPARPLRGAVADLEALLGHAVVLTDDELHDYWKVPENFGSCVCVPVSSPTMPLGTLWAFCREPRDFTDAQTNILEVVAGRVAADLERQVLVSEALAAREQTQQISAAEQSQQEQLPRIAPMIEGWEVAAKAYQAGSLGGTFYDWFSLADGALAVVAGDALDRGVGGALTASALRATARSLAPDCKAPRQLLEKANSILWTGSAGNQCAGLFQAIIDPTDDEISFAAAGPMRVVAVHDEGFTRWAGPTSALGQQEEIKLRELHRQLSPGELMFVYGTTFLADADEQILAALDHDLATMIQAHRDLPAGKLVAIAGQVLEAHPTLEGADRVLLMLKRRDR